MNSKKSYWLYIDPYVHISVKNTTALLYNTLNGKVLEVKNTPSVIKIIKQLKMLDNTYVIKLFQREYKKPEIAKFINNISDLFMGGLLDTSWYKKKPIQIIPELRIMDSPYRFLGMKGENWGRDILSKLIEISLYINSRSKNNHSKINNTFKQFLFPSSTSNDKNELNIEQLKKIICQCKHSNLYNINILGDSIINYSYLRELVSFLNTIPMKKSYFLHYTDFKDFRNFSRFINFLNNSQTKEKIILNIFFNFLLEEKLFTQVLEFLKVQHIKINYCFVIQKEEDFEEAELKVNKYDIANHSYFPFYNGKNLKYFKDAIFLTKKEVVEAKPSQKEILRRTIINDTKFGKLTILSNGNIHSDVNSPKLGDFGTHSILEVLYKEVTKGKSWRQLRSNVLPCRKCTYQYLCPPLSNYESAIGRNNICHIWGNGKQ